MSAPENQKNGRRKRKNLLFYVSWGVIILVVLLLALARYGLYSFFPNPRVISPSLQKEINSISPEGAFVISFDQRMRRTSVEEALSIVPQIDYKASWEGNTLFLRPLKTPENSFQYRLSLTKKAMNFFGKPLDRSYSFIYMVGNKPSIVAVFPRQGEIEPDEKVIILFSHAMVRESEVGHPVEAGFVRMSPAVQGDWIWYNDKTLVFRPLNGFPLSSRFWLNSPEPIQTLDATVLDDTIDVTFETERLELMKMIQERSEEDSYGVRDPFPVQFSQAVDSTSLTKASTLRSSKGSLVNGLRFEVDRNDPSRFELRAEGDKWWYNEDYTLSISEDLIPQGGNLALEEPIEITFRTESFLVFDTEWSVIQKDIILTEDGSFYLGTMENWKSDRLLRSLRLDPPGELVIGTQRGRFFNIQLDEDSQKRENILLVLEDKGGENEKAVVREPSVYTLKHAPSLRLTMNDRDEQVCFYSNNALGQKTFLESTLEGVVKSNSLTWDEGSDCSKREEYAFQYSFGKNVLEPQKSHTIYLHAYDIYGQQETQKYIVQARALNPTERVLLRQESEFYQFFHSAEDLVFPYDVENIPEVKVEICRLSAGQAVQIETTYEQRWYSFTPSTEKCLGYSAFSQTLKSNWGTQIQEEVRLDQNMKEIVQGLYYVRISLPSRSLKEDAELMADGVLEYTHWNLMTKRGESTLAWLIDSDENKPISGADITLFGGDGERLYGGKTDDRGILLVDKNRFKHEFVMAKINEKEILLNAFSQQGFEPERFSILFNADESPYRYQFYIQEPSISPNLIKGAFMIREKDYDQLRVPSVSTAVVSLYTEDEHMIWRQYETVNEGGVLFFDIAPKLPLLENHYNLSVCLGLHEGVCQGINFWTRVEMGGSHESTPDHSKLLTENQDPSTLNFDFDENKIYSSGEELKARISGLIPHHPILITLERNGVLYHEIRVSDSTSDQISIPITEEMVPEVFLGGVQFNGSQVNYQLKRVKISTSQKEIIWDDREGLSENPLLIRARDGSPLEDYSLIAFRVDSNQYPPSEDLLKGFYPSLGTSVLTASSSQTEEISDAMMRSDYQYVQPSDSVVWVRGVLDTENRPRSIRDLNPEAPYFLAVSDKLGDFGNLTLKRNHIRESLKVSVTTPHFLRPDDEFYVETQLINNGTAQINVQIQGISSSLQFPLGGGFFIGLPPQATRTITLHTKTLAPSNTVSVPFSIRVNESDENPIESSFDIPLVRYKPPVNQRQLVLFQERTQQATLKLPPLKSGEWDVEIFISPSPISFVLSELRSLLLTDSLTLDQALFQLAISAEYSDLLTSPSLESNDWPDLLERSDKTQQDLEYLGEMQKSDGGWSYDSKDTQGHFRLSTRIAKALALLSQVTRDIPDSLKSKLSQFLKQGLDNRVNARIREQIDPGALDQVSIFEEIQILNALSSLTPSGISYANAWYQMVDHLSNPSRVLLLLTLEDYRDAGIQGVSYKIEELIQLLKQERVQIDGRIWLQSNLDSESLATDFLTTSWYLESLVRQASARSDLPAVITWLVENSQNASYQTPYQQFNFLQAMSAYLRIFQEEVPDQQELTVQFSSGEKRHITWDPNKIFQSSVFHQIIRVGDEADAIPSLTITSVQIQPLFVEVSWESKSDLKMAHSNGLSLYQELEIPKKVKIGDHITGRISIISPVEREQVVVIHPQIAGAEFKAVASQDGMIWKTRIQGDHERRYLIDILPEGETVIPFEWVFTHSGVFTLPPIFAYLTDQPQVSGSTSERKITVGETE